MRTAWEDGRIEGVTMLKGKITISRPSGSGANYIQIEIKDYASGISFLQARIGYADFAQTLTGLGYMPCKFELTADNVGLVAERKKEAVLMKNSNVTNRLAEARYEIGQYEVDGWRGRVKDALNSYNIIKRYEHYTSYSVSFIRYVEADSETDNPD